MPACFSLQVLDHDAREDDEFGIDGVEDVVVGEVETLCRANISMRCATMEDWKGSDVTFPGFKALTKASKYLAVP